MIVNHQGSSHFFFFLFFSFNDDIDDSGRDMADVDRFASIKNEDPGRSKSRELFTRGFTSAIEVDRSVVDLRASSTREGLSLRGRALLNR